MTTEKNYGEEGPSPPLEPQPDMEDSPEAARVVKLNTPCARELAALRSHEADLAFCTDALKLLRYVTEEEPGHRMLEGALWTAALVRYFRCFFGGPTRPWRLSHTGILREPDMLAAFEELRATCFDLLNNDAASVARFATGVALDGDWRPLGLVPLDAGPQHGPDHHRGLAQLAEVSLGRVREQIASLVVLAEEEVQELDAESWSNTVVVWTRPPRAPEAAASEG